jgi:hypothetical protein
MRVGPMAQDVKDEYPEAVTRDSKGRMFIKPVTLADALGIARSEEMAHRSRQSDEFMRNMTLGQALKEYG